MPPEPLGPLNDRKTSRRDSRISSRAIEPPSAMATKLQSKPTKSESLASEATLDSNNDEILPKRHLGKNAGAVGSTQVEPHDMDGPSNRSSEESSEDRDVAAQLEKKRLEHEHQRNMKREQFEQQMQQLEIQQLQEEQAMLASKSRNSVTATNPITELSQGLVSIRSLPVSRRNSNDGVDPWSDIEKLSLGGDKSKRSVELPKLGRSSTMKDGNLSPSESTFDDNTHLNQFTERFIFDDDSTAGTGSRLNSLQRSIWKDQQDLGTGSSAIGGSYLPRYLQIGANDNDDFPTMRPSSSSALDLAQIPHTSGLRHPGTHDLGRNSEWPQFNQTLPSTSERHGSIIGFTGVGNTKDSLKTTLPKLTPAYSSSEIPTRFNKAPSLTPFDDMPETDSRGLLKSEMNSSDVCLQFQQGHCPRGDMCPYAHTNILPSTSRPSAGMPLSPGVGMSVGSVSFYSRMNSLSGAGSSSGLTNVTGFPFSTVQNGGGFELPSTGSNNVPRMQQQQQQQVNGGSSKGNQKRAVVDVEANRFAGAMLESFVGQIYSLCKDQHGCRYLQKKLEEQNETYLTIIFGEVFGHFVELMTDPFGNYLCQKLLEFCGDDQRTAIVETVAPELVNISLNMHGTRAVQKMIEFLSTPQQIAIVVVALNPSVVTLIKDLNGNHVIQKCLNRLASEDNQFIYNAISTHCIEVATHRHGCCVLQRCIDHASVSQKLQLVREITFNALVLVQDPFGNYVVQYVLDLADSRFTDSLIRRFIGNVCALSVQKFSSNVMEKCIRVSEPETRKFLIEEMINKSRLEKMLRDSYANYVVQTSLDFADPIQRAQLVECIRPLLPAIRNTPYGKRIQSKLHRDQLSSANQLGHLNLNAMGAMNGMNGMSGMGGINGMAGMGNMGNLNSMTGLGNMGNMSNLNGMGMGNMSGMPSSMAMNMANLANSMNNMSLMNGMPMGNMPNMNNMSGMPGAMNNSNMNGMNNGTNMSGMPNAMNNNMMGFGFPGMNHYGNVGMIGMNDYNPYNGYM